MHSIETALKFKNLINLEDEIISRHRLMDDMVGMLYPSIVMNEIMQLRARYNEIKEILEANKEYGRN